MNIYRKILVTLMACIVLVSLPIIDTSGQLIFYTQTPQITLYRDGLVHCVQELAVNVLAPEISIPLLSESPQNILLLDENNSAVDYKIVGNNLTAYTLGAKKLTLEYDTIQITSKEAEVWTLTMQIPYNASVFLPPNSTIVYLSEIPLTIETKQNAISLSLTTGNWEISYILPALTTLPVSTKTPETTEQINTELKTEYIAILAITIASVAGVGFFLLRKRRLTASQILKANPQLGKEDQMVIQFLIEKDGKAFEAELREKFPEMPRTSLWRLVRRLERLEIVEIKKIGLENQVQLKK